MIRHTTGPLTVYEMSELLQNPRTGARELAEAIGGDPWLEGEVMRMANAACYRRPSGVLDLRRAILVLGFRRVAEMLTGLLAVSPSHGVAA